MSGGKEHEGREGRRSVGRVGENETDCGCSVCVVRSEAVLVVFGGGGGPTSERGGVGSKKGRGEKRGGVSSALWLQTGH